MENQIVLTHDFCKSFREDIKRYGLVFVVKDQILGCCGTKVEMRKAYLARESKKKSSFRGMLRQAIEEVEDKYVNLRQAARELKAEIAA